MSSAVFGPNNGMHTDDNSETTAAGREEAFGQRGHVRIYAKDYRDRLEQAGFKVNVRIIIGIIGGLLSGLLQIRVLRSYYAKAGWWVPASAAGWGLCWLVSSPGGSLAAIIGFIAGGIILGLVTGIVLLWIHKFPMQRE